MQGCCKVQGIRRFQSMLCPQFGGLAKYGVGDAQRLIEREKIVETFDQLMRFCRMGRTRHSIFTSGL